MIVRALGVWTERLGRQSLVSRQHTHLVTPHQGPAVWRRDGADWPVQDATGQAGARAVIRHDEVIAEALPPILYAQQGRFGSPGLLDLAPLTGIEVDER